MRCVKRRMCVGASEREARGRFVRLGVEGGDMVDGDWIDDGGSRGQGGLEVAGEATKWNETKTSEAKTVRSGA